MSNDFRLPVTPQGEYPDDRRVRLRGSRTDVYDLAKANAEGWVRAHNFDPVGKFPMILVEWDTDHWTYNGQGNMWTFEDHFELVNEDKMKNDDELRQALKVIAEHYAKEDDPGPTEAEIEDDLDLEIEERQEPSESGFLPATNEQYISTLRQALQASKDADSFILIAVGKETHPQTGRPILAPRIFKADKTEEAALLLGTHVHQIGLLAHQELAIEAIAAVAGDE